MSNEYELGQHAAEIAALKTEVSEIKADVKEILATMNRAAGGWRAVVLIAGISSILGGFMVELIRFLWPFLHA